jgi:hypothetical protein
LLLQDFSGECALIQHVFKRGSCRFCLFTLLAAFAEVHAAEPIFGALVRADGSVYQVPKTLSERSSNLLPFRKRTEREEWNFDWIDLQPAFPTKRFECRNPERPLSCLSKQRVSLPSCGEFENLESNFVKLSLTKSSYGDTPEEQGIPSAWSKMSGSEKATMIVTGPPAALGAALGVGAAVVVMSPFIALGAIMHPECVGWSSKWVEFDHNEFNEKIRAGLLANGQETTPTRSSIESRFRIFTKMRNDLVESEYSRLKSELNSILDRAKPYEMLISVSSHTAAHLSLQRPALTIDTWNPPLSYVEILADYDELSQINSQQIITHFRGQRELKVAAISTYLENVAQAVEETTRARFANADSVSRMESLLNDLQRTADPAGLIPQATERLKVLQKVEKSQQELAERRRVEQAKKDELRRQEDERKANVALSVFRKSLKIGVDTNCGPVIEIRSPMVRIASIDSGTDRWAKISTLFPSGRACDLPTVAAELPTIEDGFPPRPTKVPGVVSCNTNCINAMCLRTYDSGKKVRFQAKHVFDPFSGEWKFDSGNC